MTPIRQEHDITIYAKGSYTNRECYCLATNGFDHHEYDSPWVMRDGTYERSTMVEDPPDLPFRDGESPEDHREREISARIWDEAAEATAEWSAAYTHGDNGPPDPPRNPYLDD